MSDKEKQEGFDKWLDYQYRMSGDFYLGLWEAIMRADEENSFRLAKGFPHEVEAYRVWTRVGCKAFLAECSPDNPLVERMRKEYDG